LVKQEQEKHYLLAKTLAGTCKFLFCIADATVITEAGYVGEM
jgi:ATP-dependent protease Clp ATPase subunit